MSAPAFHIGADTWPGLLKLAEECAELGAVAIQLMTFPDDDRPDEGPSLADRLVDELADVTAAVMYVRAHNAHDRMRFAERTQAKFERFQLWDYEADK